MLWVGGGIAAWKKKKDDLKSYSSLYWLKVEKSSVDIKEIMV